MIETKKFRNIKTGEIVTRDYAGFHNCPAGKEFIKNIYSVVVDVDIKSLEVAHG